MPIKISLLSMCFRSAWNYRIYCVTPRLREDPLREQYESVQFLQGNSCATSLGLISPRGKGDTTYHVANIGDINDSIRERKTAYFVK